MELTKEEVFIEKLKLERSILADGGYGRSVRTPWRPTEYFRDSIVASTSVTLRRFTLAPNVS